MALRKVIQVEGEAFVNTPSGQVSIGNQKTAFNAYCKIVEIRASKERGRVTVECKAENYNAIKQFSVPFSVEDGALNFVKQAYEHLKTLPEWADATDC
jgi:hypothetical protein